MTPRASGLVGGLDLLTAIVQTGSFVAAGERLRLTQSGVSRAVARLERQIGVRLFDRNARAVTLTDEGRRFHAQVAPLVTALEDAIEGAAGATGQVRGRLRINVDPFFAHYVLTPRLAAFLDLYPELELELIVRAQASDLVADGFDAAVRFGEPALPGVVARRLLETRIVTCASPAYLARHGRPRHPGELADGHAAILFLDPSTGRPFDWEFHQGKKRLRVDVRGRLIVNDVKAATGACLGGHGVAQLMAIGARDLLRDGQLVELFPRWNDEIYPAHVLLPSRRLPPAKVRAFLDFVVASSKSATR